MKQLIHSLAFLVLVVASSSAYCMKEALQEEQSAISIFVLPLELRFVILDELTADVVVPIRLVPFPEQKDASWSLLRVWSCIRRIMRLSRVCRNFRDITRSRVAKYAIEVAPYINQIGDPDVVLLRAIRNGEHAISRLCIMVGADINVARYTAFSVPPAPGTETLLTEAIKKGEYYTVKELFRLGADPMRPNAQGERPIDITKKRNSWHIAKLVRENGGDPDDLFMKSEPRHIDREVAQSPSLPMIKQKKSNFELFPIHKIGLALATGAVVSGISCWLYRKWKKSKTERDKRQQELRDRYRLIYG